MKHLHFYLVGECNKREYLTDWVNWNGEIPQSGDFVKLDCGKKEFNYRVLGRIIDECKPYDLDIVVVVVK